MAEKIEKDAAAVSRRNALKAGAALGVGAAAFAGPQIGVLGAAPAFGQAGVCSKPIATLTADLGSLNNGAGQCGPEARINMAFRPGNVTQNGINATWDDTGCLGSSIIMLTASENWCTVVVRVEATSCAPGCTDPADIAEVSVGPVAVGGTIPVNFPLVTDGLIPNGTGFLTINCSNDIDCVPGVP